MTGCSHFVQLPGDPCGIQYDDMPILEKLKDAGLRSAQSLNIIIAIIFRTSQDA